MFDASAGSISAEKFFTDFVEKRRNNVEITFDQAAVGRIAAPYVERAKEHAQYRLQRPANEEDLQATTVALVSFTAIRKMLLAVPASEQYELGRFKTIKDVEWFAPKSVIAAVDNIGKFEHEDFVARLKYNSQDIFRLMMETCKVMDRHQFYGGKYSSPVQNVDWEDLDTSTLVITSESSARWIRDKAREYLKTAFAHHWTVTITGNDPPEDEGGDPIPWQQEVEVTYPNLPFDDDPDKQIRNVLDWLALLNNRMPFIRRVVAAGFATCWKLIYFQRIGHMFRNIEDRIPDWFNDRPYDILTELNLHHADVATDDYDGTSYVGFVNEIHRYVINKRVDFNQFLELAKQPDTAFGSPAQLIVYKKDSDFTNKEMFGLAGSFVANVKNDAQAESVVKIKNKGQTVSGLLFAFSSKVEVSDNYLSRVNGNPTTLKNNYLKSDFKSY